MLGPLLLGIVLCGTVFIATSTQSRRRMPEVELMLNGQRIPGDLAGGCLVDLELPEYRAGMFVDMPHNGGFNMALSGPRPSEMEVTLYDVEEGRPGYRLSSAPFERPRRRVTWDAAADAPGDYILEVYVDDRAGNCWLYWFPLALQ